MAANKLSFLKPFQNSAEWRTSSHRGQQIKQRANSHIRPAVTEVEDSVLFHTVSGSNLAYMFPGRQNIFWFILEESIIEMFQNEGNLREGQLQKVHETVKELVDLDSVYGRLRSELLPKAMAILRSKLEEEKTDYLAAIESVWAKFLALLPTLECMLFTIDVHASNNKNTSIRKAALVAFRDFVLLSGDFEERLKQARSNSTDEEYSVSAAIRQMVLVLQDVCECFPPSKNKLEMERICALVVSPYLGYRGLYLNYNQIPAVKSNEPDLVRAARPKVLGLAVEGDRLVKPVPHYLRHRTARTPARKVSIQPVLQVLERSKSPNSQTTLNYLMARIYK